MEDGYIRMTMMISDADGDGVMAMVVVIFMRIFSSDSHILLVLVGMNEYIASAK